MKLNEIISTKQFAVNLKNNRTKTKRSKQLIDLLKIKAKSFNPTKSKTPNITTHDPFGGMTGYPSFKQFSVDQSNWR